MTITASLVKELREKTGVGMMECKKALKETDGDLARAIEYLQIKGLSKAAKKADRIAAEGIVSVHHSDDGRSATIVELNCETDFVSRNEDFQAFGALLAAHALESGIDDVDAFLNSTINGQTVEELRTSKIAAIGENISVRQIRNISLQGEGVVGSYIHNNLRVGVITAIATETKPGDIDALRQAAVDVSMHVAALGPEYLSTDDVDSERIERERRVLTEQAAESGKPPEIIAKMIAGRLQKWKQEICLLDQPFVKEPDVNIAQYVARVAKETNTKAKVTAYTRIVVGEGIEKKTNDLAAEVAALSKGS